MKLHVVAVFGVVLTGMMSVGCGSGLGHHGKWAKASGDEVGTATLLSESIPLPASRMSVAQWNEPWESNLPDPALKTWGAPTKPEDKYGF